MRWRRWFPAPLLSLFLLIVWLLLSQSAAPGHWVLGGIMAWLAPWITRRLRPYGVAVRRPWAAVRLIWRVAVDIVKSNWDVSWVILGRRERRQYSGFMEIPLDMRHPYSIAALTCIITGCPGTVWAGLTEDRRILTIHVLDLQDENEWIDIIKNRYESLLMEIFESAGAPAIE